MKIREALGQSRSHKQTISSKKAGMYEQSPSTILNWLFVLNESEGQSVTQLVDILRADDWRLDGKARRRKNSPR